MPQHQFNTTPNILGSLVGGFKDGYNIANTIRQNQSKEQFQLEDREIAGQQRQAQNQFNQQELDTRQLVAEQKMLKQEQASQPPPITPKQKLAELKFKSAEDQQMFENNIITEQQDNAELTSIALTAARIRDPIKVREFLKGQMASGSDRVNQLVTEATLKPDAEMMADVMQQARSGQSNSDRADQIFNSAPVSKRTQELIDAKVMPGTPEFREAILKGTRGINIDNRRSYETAEEKAFSKAAADQFAEIATGADSSQNQLALIDSMRNIDVKTGMFESAKATLGSFAEALGIDQSFVDVGSIEAFEATTTKMVNESLRLNKGVQTEGDAQRSRKEMATVEGSEKGNTFKLNIMESVARRKIEQDRFIRSKRSEGMKAEAALGAWRDYISDTPSISKSRRKNGMPVFFYQFEQFVKSKNPDATRDEIIQDWKGQQ